MTSELKTKVVLEAVDRISNVMQRITRNFTAATSGMRQRLSVMSARFKEAFDADMFGKIGQRIGGVVDQTKRMAFQFVGFAAVAGYAFKRLFLDPASQFEQFNIILETIEGSSAKAAQSLQWVSNFASTTPYELEGVMDAFVKLRAYGLDPTNGTLRTLGDTAAAMGKPLMQAVEALADAITGENERLKEFGIKARIIGQKVVYEYTDNGKTIRKAADLSNRAMILSTLLAIWNSKYSGAMDKQSRGWRGMISNISDQWTRFSLMVMEAGVFDFLKDRLSGLLNRINALAENGQLAKIAKEVGGRLLVAFRELWQFLVVVIDIMRALGRAAVFLRDLFGSWTPLIVAVGAVIAGPLIGSIVALVSSLVTLGLALGATPFSLFVAGAVIVAGAAGMLIGAWNPIATYWPKLWDVLVNTIGFAADKIVKLISILFKNLFHPIDRMKALLGLVNEIVTEITGINPVVKIKQIFEPEEVASLTADRSAATSGNDAGTEASTANRNRSAATSEDETHANSVVMKNGTTDFLGQLKITIDSEGRPRSEIVQQRGPVGITVDTGLMLSTP